jgi:hypothetical protein
MSNLMSVIEAVETHMKQVTRVAVRRAHACPAAHAATCALRDALYLQTRRPETLEELVADVKALYKPLQRVRALQARDASGGGSHPLTPLRPASPPHRADRAPGRRHGPGGARRARQALQRVVADECKRSAAASSCCSCPCFRRHRPRVRAECEGSGAQAPWSHVGEKCRFEWNRAEGSAVVALVDLVCSR